ncbi:hypothetical protein D3C81_1562010 [compost metagenome]
MQHIPAEPEFLQHAGTEVLDQDVRFGQQFLENLLAFGGLEVQGQALFVAGLDEPPQRRPFIQLAPFAQRVTAIGGFDLDHLRTELGADPRSEGAGNQCAEFDDFQTSEGLGGSLHDESVTAGRDRCF